MEHVRTTWVNDQQPFIDAENLNNIENTLVDSTKFRILNIDLLTGTGSGVIVRVGAVCQLVVTMTNPIAIGGRSDLFQFPAEFKPVLDFYTPLIGDNYADTLGLIAYNASTNMLTLNTASTESFMGKISFTYVTDQ